MNSVRRSYDPMPLKDFETPTEWVQDLDRRWPERLAMKSLILDLCDQQISRASSPIHLLELGIGDGELCENILEKHPRVNVFAADVNPAILDFVGDRVSGSGRVTLIQQDLSRDVWSHIESGFDVIYTLQTLHDIGGLDKLEQAYRHCHVRLKPGGLLINADFVKPMAHDDPDNPRRFPESTHQDLLKAIGFSAVRAHLCAGDLAAISAIKT